MGDPFSVTTGAVGVISLGLTVCQALLAYYGPFSAYDSETKNLLRRVEGLKSTIEALGGKVSTLQNSSSFRLTNEVRLVADRISDCEVGLKSASRILNKCRGYDALGKVQENGWTLALKGLYPFRRGTLLGLLDTVSGLQSNLDSAIQLLQFTLTEQVEQQTSLLLTVSHSIAASSSHITTSLDEMARRQDEMMKAITILCQSKSGMMGRQGIGSVPPSSLRSLCDQQRKTSQQLLTPEPHLRKFQHKHQCTCSLNQRRSSFRWSIFKDMYSHQFGCPLYFERKTATLIRTRFALCSKFLRFAIDLQLKATRGAGGFSVSPVFSIRSVVPCSPAFDMCCAMNTNDKVFSTDFFDSTFTQLERLFEERKASPMETLPDGSTLLHAALSVVQNIPHRYFPDYRVFIRRLIESFHIPINEQGSFNFARHFKSYGTALDYVISSEVVKNHTFNRAVLDLAGLASDLHSFDAVLAPALPVIPSCDAWQLENLRFYAVLLVPQLILSRVSRDLFQELPYTEFETAILLQSERDLESLLCHVGERDAPQITRSAIMASVTWPKGLQMILGKVHNKEWIDEALGYAIDIAQHQSVHILLTIGRRPIHCCTFSRPFQGFFDPDTFRTIASCLASRRKALLAAARSKLPQDILQKLNVPPSLCIPDRQASGIYKALKEHRCQLNPEIIPEDYDHDCSVYRFVDCNIQAADILFEVGFTQPSDNDNMNALSLHFEIQRPLFFNLGAIQLTLEHLLETYKDYLEMCEWLCDKGSSVYFKSPERNTLPIHHIAHELGDGYARFIKGIITKETSISNDLISKICKHWKRLFDRHELLLWSVLMDNKHEDQCLCACSVEGCHASTILLNRMVLPFPSKDFGYSRLMAKFIGIQWSTENSVIQEIHDALAPVAIRVCTFKELELTHTCNRKYKHDNEGDDNGDGDDTAGVLCFSCRDVAAIRAEEHLLIDRLEELVSEFEAKYIELAVPLPKFLTGYWESRMKEINAMEEIIDEEEVRRMREVGVVVEIPD